MKVSDARAQFRAVIERVKKGEEVALTQNGETVAVLVQPSRVQARNAAAQKALDEGRKILEALEEARQRPLDIGKGLTQSEAEELIAWVRAGRDAS